VARYRVGEHPDVADPSSEQILLHIRQPYNNHNGGGIQFGPDGYLYIGMGDGGSGGDPENHAQRPDSLLGKMLRVDVESDLEAVLTPADNPFAGKQGWRPEIWALGLRNPWRFSFDRETGDLWIGDVGQDNREEIDFQPASSTGGENYGWRLREGDIATPTGGVGGAPPTGHDPPVYAYTHADTTVPPVSPAGYEGSLVTGGYVYRGPDPSLQGKYFFLDASSNNHWMANTNPFGSVTNIDSLLTPNTGSASFAVSFGEDAVGNLYIAYMGSGEVYRIATNQLLKGDFDADGDVDNDDYTKWRSQLGSAASNPPADGNGNAIADAADIVVWRNNFGASVHTGAGGGTSVPEPATAIVLIQSVALLAFRNLFRRSSSPRKDASCYN